MPLRVRTATEDDVPAIAALTATSRARLAGWSPLWWRPSAAADEIHPLWLGHLLGSGLATVRVADDGGTVVGCAVAMPQPGRWFVDDVAVAADDRWSDAGAALLAAITERPALTCTPTEDGARRAALDAAGLRTVARYWIAPTRPDGGAEGAGAAPLPPGAAVPPPPPHTFGGALDPWAPGALTFTYDGGLVVGSPSTPAPPVYDPGGPVAIVDRVVGPDPAGLLRLALGTAARRGDVLLAVVAAAGDAALERALGAEGFVRTVEVDAWP